MCVFPIYAQKDSAKTNHCIMRSTLYGIGQTNLLDTYLSPMEYKGMEVRMVRENMRTTRMMNGNISRQSLFQVNMTLAENKAVTSRGLSFLANWNLAYHYKIPINENFKILVGPNFDLNGGMLYNMRNSNNPINAKAYANIGASGMAIYHFHFKQFPFVFRYQLNIPLLGVMFSPEYGQPYYEMSLSHNLGENLCITSLHNQPSVRQFLTLDFPIKSATLRIGYVCDIQQAKVNKLKSHMWSHTFMIGFVKNFYMIPHPY